ncbi:MAG: hypothetical protein J5990_07655 [Bacteroidales bacterium]|nr:hypothetical protein [Bacteroidales bacterium]
MNIIVKSYGSGLCYCRPDTTWERENKDFYSPECVNELHWAPIVFVRICKAGKCIGQKFASRYYDAFNFGALLYCHTPESSEIAFTSCTDHSSLLPAPLYNPVVLENDDNIYEVRKNGETIFSSHGPDAVSDSASFKALIEDAVCRASRLTSLRIGDFLAIELAPKSILASREEGEINFKATYCENESFDMKLIF